MMSSSARPDLRVNLKPGFTLSSPVVAASGGFGYGDEIADLADPSALGALITPTITISHRSGNPMPRTAETSAGLLHSLGRPNPGLQCFLSKFLPRLRTLGCPVVANIFGASEEEWRALGKALDTSQGVAGLELNLSDISIEGEASILAGIAAAVRVVRSTTALPLMVKLPAANVEIGTAARAAEQAGADVISVSQGFPGAAVRLSSQRFRLPGVVGDVSGPCIKPLALYQVWRVAQSVGCPILGSGGIMTGEDALEFLIAGASAVAVGAASSIHPNAIAHITADVTEYLAKHRLTRPSELVGVALRTH